MIVSHEWLKQFCPHTLSPTEVGELLSRHTVTLDGIESTGADLSPFVVATVVQAARHPNSDRLWVTKVDDGRGELLDVVCGAPNVVAGTKYPFARTGTLMPAGITIEKRKIRGETSNGMLCSARELGLGEEHDGILALDTDVANGTPLLAVLPASDARLNLDVLPNRPDLLSHRGVARELSALSGVSLLQFPVSDFGELEISIHGVGGVTNASEQGVSIRNDDAESCPRYLAAIVRGVKVGPSPDWLVKRLDSIGVRSISNIVDVTNYVLHAFGQPVHAFDLNKLAGRGIVVRPTTAGESIVTLDGVERKLDAGTTVICDGERPVALAGIMGGRDSEVTDTTTDILLEVAHFSPRFVRKVRRAVGLNTDASYRFERGIDAGVLLEIATYTAAILAQAGNGSVTSLLAAGVKAEPHPVVTLRPSRATHLIGTEVSVLEMSRHLEALGCKVTEHGDTLQIAPPSWRHDLGAEVDVIEEIARLKGFDTLPDELRATRPGNVPDHPLYVVGRRVRNALVEMGLAETRPMPFTKTGTESLRVRNPLADDEPFLRQSILETLSHRAEFNFARMQGNIRLFEVGNVFVDAKGRLPREEIRVGALVMGKRRPPHFTEPNPPAYDMWDAKAIAEGMVKAAFPPGLASITEGEGDVLWEIESFEDRSIGRVVRVRLDKPVWASDAYGVELTLGLIPSDDVAAAGQNVHGSYAPLLPDAIADAVLYSAKLAAAQASGALDNQASVCEPPITVPGEHTKYKAIPTTPAAEFDLALIVPDNVSAMRVHSLLLKAAGELLESVQLFDEFRGAGVPAGHRSLAWHLTFRHPERTLRDKEIEGRRNALLETLSRELGIKPRAT